MDNNSNNVNLVIVLAILVLFGIIGWAVWNHLDCNRCNGNGYRMEGPGWKYEYRDNYRRHDRNSHYRREQGQVEVGPYDIRWR